MTSKHRLAKIADRKDRLSKRQPRRTGPVPTLPPVAGRGHNDCRTHRWGGFRRNSAGRFVRHCRRRACRAAEAVQCPEAVGLPYSMGRYLFQRARKGGGLVIVELG